MTDEQLLRIGPFSRASSLSVKALRAYHESGLLVPAVVDPWNGYRSYTAAQLTDATIIRRLRELDVPLDAVRRVLDARDPEVTRKVLAEHGAVLEDRVATMQRAIDDLYASVENPSLHTPVHTRHEPATTVLALDRTIGGDLGFEQLMDHGRVLLRRAAVETGAVVTGAYGGAFATWADDDALDVTWFLPIADPPPLLDATTRSAGVRIHELPSATVAVLAHRGGYGGLDEPYRLLGAWVAANATSADLPVRERYVVGPDDVDLADDFRTEICWPIEPEEA